MLLLDINRKPYVGIPIVWLNLTLVILKSQCQGHSDFESQYLVGAKISHMLRLHSTGKQYRGAQ